MKHSHRKMLEAYEGERVICSDCGHECDVVLVDHGIGGYEYWGAKGVHHDYAPGSDCCGEDVVPGGCVRLRTSVHTAREDHESGRIKSGDVYRVEVFKAWRDNGPSWIWQEKNVIKRNVIGYAPESGKVSA